MDSPKKIGNKRGQFDTLPKTNCFSELSDPMRPHFMTRIVVVVVEQNASFFIDDNPPPASHRPKSENGFNPTFSRH